MRRSIIGCAIVLCFFSPSLFAGDVRVTVRKAGGEQIQKTDIPATDTKNGFEKKKQELRDIVDRIAKLRSHAVTIDWGDGTPPPSLTVTIDWGDGTPPSSLTVTNVVARPGGFGSRGIALQSYRATQAQSTCRRKPSWRMAPSRSSRLPRSVLTPVQGMTLVSTGLLQTRPSLAWRAHGRHPFRFPGLVERPR